MTTGQQQRRYVLAAGEELVFRDAAGREIARVRLHHAGKEKVKLGVVAPRSVPVRRGELPVKEGA